MSVHVIVRHRNQSEVFRYRETPEAVVALSRLTPASSLLSSIDPTMDTMFNAVQLDRVILAEIEAIVPTNDVEREALARLDEAVHKADRLSGYLWICPEGSHAAKPDKPRGPSGDRFPGLTEDWFR